jgi:CO/xanthine dehydrogenase FAD-binding subunit
LLVSRPAVPAIADLLQPDDLAPPAPIDDLRASAAYRLDATATLLRRALADVCSRPDRVAAEVAR